MEISILSFGIAKEIIGAPAVTLTIDEDTTVAGLKQQLEQQYPRLRQLTSYLIARNNVYAEDSEHFRGDDEVALIPPVSGG